MKPESRSISLGNTQMDYVVFGNGSRALIMLPGLGDGLKTVKKMAAPLAWSYRLFAADYRVYVFSRKNDLPAGYTTRDMAADQIRALEKLDIGEAAVLGVSQGGMIAQYVAIDAPERVEKLVLAVTASRPNALITETVGGWIRMAREGNYGELLKDTAERSYSEQMLLKYRALYPMLTRLGKPDSFKRFLIQAQACLTHDAYGELEKILCPTLVIGGGQDRIVGPGASEETAERICGSILYIYPELGHGAYEEAGDFNKRVLDFLLKDATIS